jgi:hypothetical protein
MAIIQYFTCSLVSIEIEGDKEVDMNAWYQKQRVAFLSAFASLCVIAMLTNYVNRDISRGLSVSSWISSDAPILLVLLLILVAILARAKWLQWVAPLIVLIIEAVFIILSVVPN